jgi:hypothetical protein
LAFSHLIVGVIMKILRSVLPALATLFVCATAQADTFSTSCKTSPAFLSSIRKSIEGMVTDEIDGAAYSDGRATVQLKLLSLQGQTDSVTTEELLANIVVEDSGHPTGLAFGVTGDIDLGVAGGTCVYTYRVIVTTRGRDNDTGDRINTRTDTIMTVTTPPYGAIRRN